MRKGILTLAVVLLGLTSLAQTNLILYHMESVPQRLSVNPALDPDCKWYFGTPVMSSTDFNFQTNQLSFNKIDDAFVQSGPDEYRLNLSSMGDLVGKNAFINSDVNVELLTFGFRLHKSFFHASLTEKVKTRVYLPGDLFKLAFEGNGAQNLGYEFKFNVGADILHTRELAVGYQRTFLGDKLKVGGRLKYVYGVSTINTERNDLTFTTNRGNYAYNLKSDIKLNVASSFLSIQDGFEPDPAKVAFGAKNNGWGIDLGAQYELTNRIDLSASVVDLGYINWNENTLNIQSRDPNAEFTFRGVDLKDFSNSDSTGGGLEALGDTLLDVFALDTFNNSFSTTLMGGMYVGGTFKIFEKHKAGALLYGSFYNKTFYPGLTLSWNSRFGRVLGVSASYCVLRGNPGNIGLGASLNLGPEQFYFSGDNLIGMAMGNARNVSIRFGWNHTFGRKKIQEKKKDGKL